MTFSGRVLSPRDTNHRLIYWHWAELSIQFHCIQVVQRLDQDIYDDIWMDVNYVKVIFNLIIVLLMYEIVN